MDLINFYENSVWSGYDYEDNFSGERDESTALFSVHIDRTTRRHFYIWTDIYTGRFITLSVITNIYNKKTKWSTLMEFFTATGKLNFFFWQL